MLLALEKCQTVTGKSLAVSIFECSGAGELTRHAE